MKITRILFGALAIAASVSLTACLATFNNSASENEESTIKGLLRTQRIAVIRYAPSLGAPVVKTVPAGTDLDWLANQTRNGYYRVGLAKGAIGWLRTSDAQVVNPHVLGGFEAQSACATTLAQCPITGCADKGTPDGLSNTLKHHNPEAQAMVLTFDDFTTLQEQADAKVGSGVHIPVADRGQLADLTVSGGTVSEGGAVRIVGFLVAEGTGPHPNSSGESVNCGLKGTAANDFHIPVTSDTDRSEFEAIVVEMIPQERPAKWTIPALKAVQTAHRQVWIEGNLFYDGQHRVNSDPENPIGGQPKRYSLWEIHPVTKFLVCEKSACSLTDETDWQAL